MIELQQKAEYEYKINTVYDTIKSINAVITEVYSGEEGNSFAQTKATKTLIDTALRLLTLLGV